MSEVQNNGVQPTENKVYAIMDDICNKHLGWVVADSIERAAVLVAQHHPQFLEFFENNNVRLEPTERDPEKTIAEEHHVITVDGFFAVPTKDFHIWGNPEQDTICYDNLDEGGANDYSTDGFALLIACSDGTLLRYFVDKEGVGRFDVLVLGTAYKDTTLYGGAVSEQVRFKPAPAWVVVGDELELHPLKTISTFLRKIL